MASLTPDDYTVAWICALPLEAAAARAAAPCLIRPTLHLIGLLLTPTPMIWRPLSTFQVVYMGKCLPRLLRLACDVLVSNDSKPGKIHSGLIQYDYSKVVEGGILNQPSQTLSMHISQLEARQMIRGKEAVSKINKTTTSKINFLRDRNMSIPPSTMLAKKVLVICVIKSN
ncbi:hypothetical protein GB937_005692 [Aspergillus fischeri]|nr:hypothetical protein GB937_005692 [Aspergillus fischeri]